MHIIKEKVRTGTKSQEMTKREIEHANLARKAAAEGMVLLKNENNLLPLDISEKIDLYGAGAYKTIKGGTGSGDVNERKSVTIQEGMEKAGFNIVNEEWLTSYGKLYTSHRNEWINMIRASTKEDEEDMAFMEYYSSHPFIFPTGEVPKKASADIAIFVLSRNAGEGADRYAQKGDYYLSDEEEQIIYAICKLHKHVVLLLNTGGIVDLSFLEKYQQIEAVLLIGQPGMEGGNAVADVLSGKLTPSGKLTDTWAFEYEDYPSSEDFLHSDTENRLYMEDIYVGYRYFDTFSVPVRYEFGYGLSYTEFSIKVKNACQEKEYFSVEVEVTNTGERHGREVVQVYMSAPGQTMNKEFRKLVAFAKTRELKPGEKERLKISFILSELAAYDEKRQVWVMESGNHVLWVGNSLKNSKPVISLEIKNEIIKEQNKEVCPVQPEYIQKLQKSREKLMSKNDKDLLAKRREEAKAYACGNMIVSINPCMVEKSICHYKGNVMSTDKEAVHIVEKLSEEKLIYMSTGKIGENQGGNLGNAGISVPGAAAETSDCAIEEGIASITLADGPAGLRLMKYYDVEDDIFLKKSLLYSLEGGELAVDKKLRENQQRYYQYCTAIPVGTLLAQSFDTKLVEKVGEMIGRELQEFSVTLWLAPGMNIHRNPLCGRNFEYYSEEPVVTGMMAAAMTIGVQRNKGVGTTIKHFACNNQENNRMNANSILSGRALREIYLKGFEIAVKAAQPMAIMTGYNKINGVHAANNADLCTKIARDEWGFEGVIMTDWTTTWNEPECTAAGCIRAGNDLIMPGVYLDRDNISQEIEKGTLSLQDLKKCVSHSIHIILKSREYEEAEAYGERFHNLKKYIKVE